MEIIYTAREGVISKSGKLDGGMGNLVRSLIYSIVRKGRKENLDQVNGDY